MDLHDNIAAIHTSADVALREHVAAKVKRAGFPSAPAYVRAWMTARVEVQAVDVGIDWGDQPPRLMDNSIAGLKRPWQSRRQVECTSSAWTT